MHVCFTHVTAVIAEVGGAVSAAIAAVVALRAVLTPPALLACTMQTSGEPTSVLGAVKMLPGPLWSNCAEAFSTWKE